MVSARRNACFRPGEADERTCPACDKQFRTGQGLMAHLASARSCKWYNKGKNVDYRGIQTEETSAGNVPASPHPYEGEIGDFDDIMEDLDLFRLVLPESSEADLRDQASSSSVQEGQLPPGIRRTALALDDDEDSRVQEEDPLHGRVIRMSETVMETWKTFFSEDLDDQDLMNVDGEECNSDTDHPNRWKPFASELDWKVAMWAVREDVGQGSLNRLLAIPGVSPSLFS